MKKYLILLFLVLLPAVVPAQESDSLDVEQPATSYTLETVPNVYRLDRRLHVSDPTGILSAEARSAIDRIFTQLEDSTGIQTAVVMLPSIGEDNIFDFAHNLFMEWGVGEKERDNGLLILYVEDQRKIRFHVGYGLEGILPDAICKRIQAKYMVPAFKEGNVDQGMVTGCKAIYQTLENAMNPNKQGDGSEGAMAALAVLVLMVIVFIWIIRNAQQKALTCKKCGTDSTCSLAVNNTERKFENLFDNISADLGVGDATDYHDSLCIETTLAESCKVVFQHHCCGLNNSTCNVSLAVSISC